MTTLTVTRKDQECVVLVLPSGKYITVRVCARVKGGTRLVISAPEDVRIWREEVLVKATEQQMEESCKLIENPKT
jgi:sRNA-binding carbon storage regulator CsrA